MGAIDKIVEKFLAWCHADTPAARFERTVAQGLVAVVVAGVTTGEWGTASIVAAVMAVLAPVQAEIGKGE